MEEYQKWAVKNPSKSREVTVKILKELGIYEELRSETNSETIQLRTMQKIGELSDDEKKKFDKKVVKIYEADAPGFFEELEKDFPWHLRYRKTIFVSIVLISLGLGFLIGYLLEPEEKKNIAN